MAGADFAGDVTTSRASTDGPDGRPGTAIVDPASFRDPRGVVFRRDGVVYRQIDRAFEGDWDALFATGLYEDLTSAGLLIPHLAAPDVAPISDDALTVIRPQAIEMISYPYEWSFGQLRDAALVTLEAHARAVGRGMTLRDASAFNVQFQRGRPVLIDTLSLGLSRPDAPWRAYRQFCRHFLAPLALMAYRDPRCGLMLRGHLDGIPLDLASRLLPIRTRLRPGLLSHLHLHARAEGHTPSADLRRRAPRMTRIRHLALVDSLRRTVEGLRWEPAGTVWVDYAETTSYDPTARAAKRRLVLQFLEQAGGQCVWDLGANTGEYSRIAAGLGRSVVSIDGDPAAVERNYREVRQSGEERILPLWIDLLAPSPSVGWAAAERPGLLERSGADAVMALALVHHLTLGGGVGLDRILDLLARIAPWAIVEFVPKSDPMARRLLAYRNDVFPDYSLEGFHAAAGRRFDIVAEEEIPGLERRLFLLRRR